MERQQLTNLFILLDCRHEAQKIDLEFIEWAGENNVPLALIFTKADKLTKAKLKANIEAYQEKLLEQWAELPPIFITSSEKAIGRDEVLGYIEEINQGL